MTWKATDMPDQSGRTVLITGANSGLGLETSRAFAAKGARVVLAVRDEARGRRAADEIRAGGGTGRLEVQQLDLSDLDSVRAFAGTWTEPLDLLINNAGVMAIPQARTAQGFEMQLGTNHLGHFALTNLLLPRLTDRVVTVSSSAHRQGTIVLDDLNWERRPYQAWRAYGQTKLANLLFTLELERRLIADHSPLRALAAHPGYSATNLQTGVAFRGAATPWLDRAFGVANRVFAQSAAMGALPTLYAATQDLPGASYVGPDGFAEGRGYPTLVGRTAEASDAELAKQLWAASEQLTSVTYPAGLGSVPADD